MLYTLCSKRVKAFIDVTRRNVEPLDLTKLLTYYIVYRNSTICVTPMYNK